MSAIRFFVDRAAPGLLLFSSVFASVASSTSAYAEAKTTISDLANGQKRVTLTQAVEPSFHIEPIVHRFSARRGTTIPFKFEIRSNGRPMDVAVIPVKLRQELSGIVLHDIESGTPDEIEFTSPTQFQLAPGETGYLEGKVTVPLAKSNYLSYGILVRDNGQLSAGESADDGTQISAGVRFVTQYVLRIDIETGVKDLSEMNRLEFSQGRIESEQGKPVAKTILSNPTNFAFECNVRGVVESTSATKPRPFRMTMPSRASVIDDSKYVVRVMPQSKVELSTPIGETLFPGKQNLKFEVTNGRRALAEEAFDVHVRRGDFPALEIDQAYLDQELSVGPGQIEISNERGAKRSCVLRFNNNSSVKKHVAIKWVDLQGNPLSLIQSSTDHFVVKPGRTKTIRASASAGRDFKDTIFGMARLSVQTGDVENDPSAQSETTEIPFAMVFGGRPTENVEVGELQSVVEAGQTSFRIRVSNNGTGYVPIHGELQVADGKSQALEMADGYGRWLKPGESRELAFHPQKPLAPGRYQLKIHVKTSPTAQPFDRTLVVQLGSETEAS